MNKKLNYFSAIKFLMKYIKPFRLHFGIFYLGWLLSSILSILMPILFGVMIDEIVYYKNVLSFIRIALMFFGCIVFSGGLYFLIYAQHGYLMNMFVFYIRKDLFSHVQKCNARYLSDSSTGEIIALLQNYSEECMHFVIRNMIHMVNGILVILLYMSYLLCIDWRMGVIAAFTGLLSLCVNIKFEGRVRKLGETEREYYEKNVSWIYEMITGLRDIRILGAGKKVKDQFTENQRQLLDVNAKTAVTNLTAQNVMAFLNLAVQLLIYAIAAYRAVYGDMTLGTLTVVFQFYKELSDRVFEVSMRYLDSQNRISFIQKIYDFLQIPPEHNGTKVLQVARGEVEFQNVKFGYDERAPLFDAINIKIAAGEHVAIVGKSGCGKTTLANLLVGFYQPQGGKIRIDGQNIADSTLESLRQSIGFIQQDVLIFDGSIRQILLMGNRRAKEPQLLEACQAAGLADFIASLKDGIDTIIGSQGIGLSGGQKQRIAIARIYLRNPHIVIFDEATSTLDQETEAAIHATWRKALEGKTAIVIAHRLSSVELCDKVILLEEGKIAEQSEIEEMRKSERFRTLFAVKGETC